MASDVQLSTTGPGLGWPSIAAASAELRRPRSSRAGRAENPAVLKLVQPATGASVVELRAARYALRGTGR
jgi:hypothetical protein